MQVINDTTFGGRLGQGLGTGIGNAVDFYTKNKMDQLLQKQQLQTLSDKLKPFNLEPGLQDLVSYLGVHHPQTFQSLVPAILSKGSTQATNQNLSDQLKSAQSPQQVTGQDLFSYANQAPIQAAVQKETALKNLNLKEQSAKGASAAQLVLGKVDNLINSVKEAEKSKIPFITSANQTVQSYINPERRQGYYQSMDKAYTDLAQSLAYLRPFLSQTEAQRITDIAQKFEKEAKASPYMSYEGQLKLLNSTRKSILEALENNEILQGLPTNNNELLSVALERETSKRKDHSKIPNPATFPQGKGLEINGKLYVSNGKEFVPYKGKK